MGVPLLFLIADTGGGHRSAALAVCRAIERAYPGRFAPVIVDPLRGRAAPARVRWVSGLYGPCIRIAPWIWGVFWHTSNTDRRFRAYYRTLFAPADRVVAAAVAAVRPAAIVSFHAMTSRPAVLARDLMTPRAPVITVITDLVTAHASWRCERADHIVAPSAAIVAGCRLGGIAQDRLADLGLPVAPGFAAGPLPRPGQAGLQRSLGASGQRFLVVLTGGAEGSGGLARRAAAILRRSSDIEVAVLCGRNARARRRLARLAERSGGRLIVRGFVENMADWLRCADLVVTKAGPGTIAEAACCGAPLVVTTHVPGQERGNAEFVVGAGAGRHAPGIRRMVAEIEDLRQNPATLGAMRAASARLGRPAAATDIAALVATAAAAAGGTPRAPAGAAVSGTPRGRRGAS